MKKTKRYEDGGEIESTQGQNKSIGDDVRARAMAAMSKSDGESEDTKYAKKLYSTEEPAIPKKTAAKLTPKATPKAEAPTPKAAHKAEAPAPKAEAPKEEKSFLKGTKGYKNFGDMFKSMRESVGITSYKSGGKVKSASSRADGCAIRGKTRA